MKQIESTMFSDYPDVVSVDELTAMLHIGKNKAYELLNSNAIQSIRIGKKHIIPKFRVIEFLMSSK
ncbi:MAG: helix-turn-helix domain-containing protein [Oscillospiraceae bacterium]|nr:helix-turn-helix domain-containing protein [Oscillospiraceae bacterium]